MTEFAEEYEFEKDPEQEIPNKFPARIHGIIEPFGDKKEKGGVMVNVGPKTFLIGTSAEAALAVHREITFKKTQRPTTHDMLSRVFLEFDIKVDEVILTKVTKGVYYAVAVLRQFTGDEPIEKEIDLRATDALILALKTMAPLYVSKQVVAQAIDMTSKIQENMVKDQRAMEGFFEELEKDETDT